MAVYVKKIKVCFSRKILTEFYNMKKEIIWTNLENLQSELTDSQHFLSSRQRAAKCQIIVPPLTGENVVTDYSSSVIHSVV